MSLKERREPTGYFLVELLPQFIQVCSSPSLSLPTRPPQRPHRPIRSLGVPGAESVPGVAPMWDGIGLVRDNITDAAKGKVIIHFIDLTSNKTTPGEPHLPGVKPTTDPWESVADTAILTPARKIIAARM